MDYDEPPKKYNSITYNVNYDKLHNSFVYWTPENNKLYGSFVQLTPENLSHLQKTKELKVMQEQIEDLIEQAVEKSACKDAKEVIDYIRGLK